MKEKVPLYEFLSFESIVHEPSRHKFFLEYLTDLGQGHKFQFWIEAREYGQLAGQGTEIQAQGAAIYDKFLAPAAYPGLNLPAPIRDEISDLMAIGRPRLYLFSRAQSFILEELKTDWYKKFLLSENYTALLKSETEGFAIKMMELLQGGPYHDFFQAFMASPDMPEGGDATFNLWLALGHVKSQFVKLVEESAQQEEKKFSDKKFLETAEVTLHTTFDIVKPYLDANSSIQPEEAQRPASRSNTSVHGNTEDGVGMVHGIEEPIDSIPAEAVTHDDLQQLQDIFQDFHAAKESGNEKACKEFYEQKFERFGSLISCIYGSLHGWLDAYFFPAFKRSRYYANIAAHIKTEACASLKVDAALSVTLKKMKKFNKGLVVETAKDRMVLNTKQVVGATDEQLAGMSNIQLFGLETIAANAKEGKMNGAEVDDGGLSGAFYSADRSRTIQCFRTQVHAIPCPKISILDNFEAPSPPQSLGDVDEGGLPEGFLRELQSHCFPSGIAWVIHGRGRQGGSSRRSAAPTPTATLHHFTLPAAAMLRNNINKQQRKKKQCGGSPMKTWAAEEGGSYYGCCLTTWVRVRDNVGVETGRNAKVFLPVAIAAVTRTPLFESLRNVLLFLLDKATGGTSTLSIMGLKLRAAYFPTPEVDHNPASDELLTSDSEIDNPQDAERRDNGVKLHLTLKKVPIPIEHHSFRALGPSPDLPILNLFKALNPSSVLQIMLALTLEYPVVIHSSVRTLLVLVCEALKSLMFPLCWQHLYNPLLPSADIVSFWMELVKTTKSSLHRRPALKPSLARGSSEGNSKPVRRQSSIDIMIPVPLAELAGAERAEVLARKMELMQLQQERMGNTPPEKSSPGSPKSGKPPPAPVKSPPCPPSSDVPPLARKNSMPFLTKKRQFQSNKEGKNWLGLFNSKKGRRKSQSKSPSKNSLQQRSMSDVHTASLKQDGFVDQPINLNLPEHVENNMKPVSCPPFFIGLETKVLEEAQEYAENSQVGNRPKNGEVWGLHHHDLVSAAKTGQVSKLSYSVIETIQYISQEAIMVDLDHDEVVAPSSIDLPSWPQTYLNSLQLEIQKVLHPELETFDLLFPSQKSKQEGQDEKEQTPDSFDKDSDIKAYTPERINYDLRAVFIKFFEDLLGRTSECTHTYPDLNAIVFNISSFLKTCPNECAWPNNMAKEDEEGDISAELQPFWIRFLGTKAFASFLAEEAAGHDDLFSEEC